MKKFAKFVLILAVALLLLSGSCMVITNENEYSLIRQFGKVDHIVDDAGISFKLPFIQTVDKLPKQTLIYDLTPSDVITADKKTMISNSYVLWRISDPLKFAQSLNSSVSNAENRLDNIVYNATKNVISSMTQDEVITSRDGALSEAVLAGIDTSLDNYGIELLSFVIELFLTWR